MFVEATYVSFFTETCYARSSNLGLQIQGTGLGRRIWRTVRLHDYDRVRVNR